MSTVARRSYDNDDRKRCVLGVLYVEYGMMWLIDDGRSSIYSSARVGAIDERLGSDGSSTRISPM